MSLTFKILASSFLMAAMCGCSSTSQVEPQDPFARHEAARALVGTWTGTYHQHSHCIDKSYPMVLEIPEPAINDEVSGSLVWPEQDGARTAISANIVNGVICIHEGDLVGGNGILVGGHYFGCLGRDGVFRGRYLCPIDGDHGETFELRRDDGASKMADQGILRIGNELVSYARPN